MTYNLGDGGKNYIPSIVNVIKKEMPDILVLNEASWLNKKPYTPEWLSIELSLPHFVFGKSNKSINHVAIFSKFNLENVTTVNGLQNAGIIAIAKTELGDVSVAGVHLASNTEDTRLVEIANIISQQKNCQFKVILGDLNSISSEDEFKDDFPVPDQLLIPDLKGRTIEIVMLRKGLQQGIPLYQGLVVLDQVVEIQLIELGNHAVNIPPPHF